MSIFSQRLRALRNEANLTQAVLGKATGLTSSAISSYENERSLPNIEYALALANHFSVSVEYLFGECVCPLSPTNFDTMLSDGINAGDVIRKILSLDNKRLDTLLVALDALSFSSEYNIDKH